MELLFRLEDRNSKNGPYSGGYTGYATEHYYGDNHPGPMTDGIKGIRDRIFGFHRLALAKRWWFSREDLIEWSSGGLRLVVWPQSEACGVTEGGHQCVFTRPSEEPLSLPAEAIHDVPLRIIEQMVADKFKVAA